MKAVINGFLTAFAMYSRIPMPRMEWNRQNRKYTLCFFPMVGAVIGALLYGWNRVCAALGIGQGCFALAGTAVPLLVTGGIHLDGLLDTADALHSYAKKEKKLEILKDPHVGAFGVITAIGFSLLYAAGLLLITEKYQLLLLAFGFVLSRTLSGMSLVWFPAAKADGTAASLSDAASTKTVRVVLTTVLALTFASSLLVQPVAGAVVCLGAMWVWTYYYYMAKREFGGITGDLAGYFLCLCELVMVLLTGLSGKVLPLLG